MSRKKPKDWELWERVKKTATPLHSNRAGPDFSSLLEDTSSIVPIAKALPVKRPFVRKVTPESPIQVTLAPNLPKLDDATTRKIARGRTSIDGKIDLHGMTQQEAYEHLFRFIDASFAMSRRTVLVITGKGVRSEGVLKQAVPRWLNQPVFSAKVIGCNEAHVSHGGSGALYVRLRNPVRSGNP